MGKLVVITVSEPVVTADGFPTGRTMLVASHAIIERTGEQVAVPNVHPEELGCTFDTELQEYIIE